MRSGYIPIFLITFILLFSSTFSTFSSVSLPDSPPSPSLINFETSSQSEVEDSLRILSFFYEVPYTLQNFDGSLVSSFVFNSLVGFSEASDRILPSLAESWVVSLDSREWTFFLRDDVFFS